MAGLRLPVFLPSGQRRLCLFRRFRCFRRLGGMFGRRIFRWGMFGWAMFGWGERRLPVGWRRAIGRLGIERARRFGCHGLAIAGFAVAGFAAAGLDVIVV